MEHLSTKLIQWPVRILICVAIVFVTPVNAKTSIGHVIFSTGDIQATNNGESRLLKRGSSISEGDIIKSGYNTRSQIRMSDGALIALRPNTEFSFDEYKYKENDDRNNTSLFNLIKGGFRTITGLIGKKSKANYRVRTTVATIGIRGTHYGLTLCQQGDCNVDGKTGIWDGLYGSVIDGEISAANDTGEYTFSNDEFFHIKSSTSKPRNLLRPPGIVFEQAKRSKKQKKMAAIKKAVATTIERHQSQRAGVVNALTLTQQKKLFLVNHIKPIFEATQDTNLSLNSFPEPANAGNVMAFSFFALDTSTATPTPFPVIGSVRSDGTSDNQFYLNSAAKDNGFFIPVAARETSNAVKTLFIGNAKVLEPSSIGFNAPLEVGWGRWSQDYQVDIDGTSTPHTGQLHYVVANNTTTPAQLGGLTGTASYITFDGTRATDLTGNVAAGKANVTMSVDFAPAAAPPGVTSFNVITRVGGNTYQGSIASPVPFSAALTGPMTLTGGTPCPSCVGQASLTFIGPNAEGAATLYTIGNSNINNAVNGASILIKN